MLLRLAGSATARTQVSDNWNTQERRLRCCFMRRMSEFQPQVFRFEDLSLRFTAAVQRTLLRLCSAARLEQAEYVGIVQGLTGQRVVRIDSDTPAVTMSHRAVCKMQTHFHAVHTLTCDVTSLVAQKQQAHSQT
ncbi:unnamed protein product [Polarella glacialis]|uniref:Uncharacterized protein n=1 Tax=Polarella glacialis TaxID=89957 RepID=A0A813E0P0_POLGL|nr:unnamed protein product [Polarella glacialis]CAE8629322.1 unnamed protein product [Polarella glacialis]